MAVSEHICLYIHVLTNDTFDRKTPRIDFMLHIFDNYASSAVEGLHVCHDLLPLFEKQDAQWRKTVLSMYSSLVFMVFSLVLIGISTLILFRVCGAYYDDYADIIQANNLY